MTISSTTNRVAYTGNGVTVAFAVAFPFHAQADLVVVETIIATGVQTTKALTTDYTISGSTDALGHYTGGGTVTAVTAPAATVTWTIYRDPALTQSVDLVENDPLPVEAAVESPLDRLTMIAQRLKEVISRSLRQPEGDSTNIAVLPAKINRLGKFLYFNATTGDPEAAAGTTEVAVSGFAATLLDDADATAGRATLAAAASGANTDITSLAAGTQLKNPANLTQALTDAASVVWNMNSGAVATLLATAAVGATRAIAAPSNIKTGGRYVLVYTQDGTGSRDLTFNAVFKGPGGAGIPKPYVAAAGISVYTFTSPDGTNLVQEGAQPQLQTITNSLGADVAMNNTANYFDGPSCAQGTIGIWLATGKVNVTDTAGTANIYLKLWDGTTTADTCFTAPIGASGSDMGALHGVFTNPAGNIRISGRDVTSTSGLFKYNQTSLGKDCTLVVVRIG